MSIARRLAAAGVAALFVALLGGSERMRPAVSAVSQRAEGAPPTLSAQRQPSWRDAPEYVALFAPASHAGSYRAYVSSLNLDAVLRTFTGDPLLLRPPGAWQPVMLSVLDAFGRSGPYDRGKLTRLYRGRAAAVARGPRAEGGQVTASWSLISPYPDRSLERLEPGTLLLVLRLGGPEGPPSETLP